MPKATKRPLVWALAIAAMAVGIPLLLWSGTAFADVAQVGSISTFADDAATFTMSSHTVPTGSDRMLVVLVQCGDGAKFASGVTWNTSENLTEFFDETNVTEGVLRNQGFRLLAPTETTANVVVTMDNSDTDKCAGLAVNFTGVNQTTPIDLPIVKAEGSTGNPSVSVATGSGEMVMDSAIESSGTLTLGSGQTQRHNLELGGGGSSNKYGASSTEASGTPVTMDWTAGGDFFVTVGFNINRAPVAYSETPTDTASLVDAFALSLGLNQAATSPASLGDAFALILGLNQVATSPASLGRRLRADPGSEPVATSPASLSDSLWSWELIYHRTSPASLGDAFALSLGLNQTATSPASLGDAFALSLGVNLPATSPASLSDAFAAEPGTDQPRTSPASLGDAFGLGLGLPRTSPASLGDAFALSLGLNQPATSPATLGDAFALGFGLPRTSPATSGRRLRAEPGTEPGRYLAGHPG